MNIKQYAGAVVAAFVVRTALNGLFYTQVVGAQYEHIREEHEGLFREVMPAYTAADLLFALIFVLLLAKVGAALGGGPKGGALLGLFVAVLGPALLNIYMYYSVQYISAGLAWSDAIYSVISGAIVGAVAGAIYKT